MKIRKLRKNDFENGYLNLLCSKFYFGTLTLENRNKILDKINANCDHIIFVVETNGKIIGGATLLMIYQLNKGTKIGKIDDVVSSKELDHKEIEFQLVKHLSNHAKKNGCEEIFLIHGNNFNPKYEKLNIQPDNAKHIDM